MNLPSSMRTLGLAGAAALLCLAPPSSARAHGDPETHMEKMDTNGDGKLSPDEHAAGAKVMFAKMDGNGDGKVTVAEMEAKHQKMMEKDKDHDCKNEMSAAEKLKVVDTNSDGVLTAEEHAAGTKTMFAKMDSNNDGFLGKAEFKVGHDKLMSKAAKK